MNFKDWQWFKFDEAGNLLDPYKILPPVFDDFTQAEVDAVSPVDEIHDGGAAMTAYARMQFSEMSELHFQKTAEVLLKYCELDTFAMVMIFEHWATRFNVPSSPERLHPTEPRRLELALEFQSY